MWFSHLPVQPSSQSVNTDPTEPGTVLPGCQGDSFTGCASRQWRQALAKALRGLLSPSLLRSTQPPPAMRHAARPPPRLSPSPCSPCPGTQRREKGFGKSELDAGACSKCWGCCWDRVLVMRPTAFFPLAICWVKGTWDSVSSPSKGPERCKSSKDVTSAPLHTNRDRTVPSPRSHG